MSIKEFFKTWTDESVKEMSKNERTNVLYHFIPTIAQFYMRKGYKSPEDVTQLFDRMENKKFVSNILRILKTVDETPMELDMAVVMSDFLGSRGSKLDDEMIEKYTKAITKLLESRTRYVVKKTGLKKDLIQEILVVVPEPDSVGNNPHTIGAYVNKVLSKLYGLAKEADVELGDYESAKKLLRVIFGKDNLDAVAVNILLEYRDKYSRFNEQQKAVWNLFTLAALDVLESKKKKEARELLIQFCERRKKDESNNRDKPRRIQFESMNEEDYPTIRKAVKKLSEVDKYVKYLA